MGDVCGGYEAKFLIRAGWGGGEVLTRLPQESSKGGSREAMQGRQVLSVEGVNKLLRVSKVSSWFPAIMLSIVAFPFDKVLILVVILTTI
jgi:hypothetical protein